MGVGVGKNGNEGKGAWWVLAASALMLLAGCAGLKPEGGEGSGAAAAAEAPPAAAVPAAEPPPAAVAPRDLAGILALLQDGQWPQGAEALRAYLKREPGSSTAKSLLQQVEADPVALLGAAHAPYTVRAGDTLGELAGRHLGDPLKFVALARYNGIARPKALLAGQTLKIPAGDRFAAAAARVDGGSGAAGEALPRPTGGTEEQALQRSIEHDIALGRIDAALATVERASAARPADGSWEGWLTPLARRVRALHHQERAAVLAAQGRREAAYEAYGLALAELPTLEPARAQRAALLRKMVEAHHETAVVHYRNQQLDEAIAEWDKALQLDPRFEPARGYRLRALELKRRLRELDASS